MRKTSTMSRAAYLARTRKRPTQPPVGEERMPANGPGGSLHGILQRMGIKPKCGCGCREFAEQMNRWGWTACLTWRAPQITSWLMSKAAEQKIEITAAKAAEFLLAAYQETLSRVRGKRKKQAEPA